MTYEDFLAEFSLEDKMLYAVVADDVGCVVHQVSTWWELHESEDDSFDAYLAVFELVDYSNSDRVVNELTKAQE